jgi:hypothetical protein
MAKSECRILDCLRVRRAFRSQKGEKMKTFTTASTLAIAVFLAASLLPSGPGMATGEIVSDETGEYGLPLASMVGAITSAQNPDGGCIASGETKSGTIFPAGHTDAYTFYGEPGHGVVIQMARISGGVVPRLRLYDPDGAQVVDQRAGADVAEIDNYQLKKIGIYTIVASHFGFAATGEYGLSLVLAPGATTSPQDPDGGDIASGETKSGTISPGGDTDAYAFYGEPGHSVVIQMARVSGGLVPRLRLYDPDGVQVVDQRAGADVAEIDNYQLKKIGIYTIVASHFTFVNTGEYGLSLSLMPPLLLMPPKNPYGSYPYGSYPYAPQPSDGNSVSLCNSHTLSWSPVNGATGYDVYLARGPCTPPEKVAQSIVHPYLPMPALNANEVYYWQVVAHTPAGDIRGPVWWFATKPCPFCTLEISTIGRGSIVDPSVGKHPYPCGQVVPVTAVADPNFEFVRWEGTAVDANKVVVEHRDKTGSKVSVTVDGVYTLTAVFEEVVRDFPLDNDPGWTMNGQWKFGVPKGHGGGACDKHGNPDPTSGHTGQNVFGVNLNGDYDVGIGGPYSLVAGPFDLRGYRDVRLRFARWLNTDEPQYVTATVDVSTDEKKTWRNLWKSETEITDSQWIPMECALGAQADGQSAVYLRWTYQVIKERAYPYSGWNLDDIQLIGSKQ